jgi:RNA polymerase sigma-70 factor (ECF subfamily)
VRRLLEECAPRVYRFALRLTLDRHRAEDLTQEALLRAWQHRQQLREASGLLAWLFQITANLWRDHLRRALSPVSQAEVLVEDPCSNMMSPDQVLAQQEEVHRALQALDGLPARQRQVLFLSACEQLSTREISTILEISPEAVKANLSLARKTLRQQFQDQTT